MTPAEKAAVHQAKTGVMWEETFSDLHYKLGKLAETIPGSAYSEATSRTADTNKRHFEGLTLEQFVHPSSITLPPEVQRRADAEWDAMDAKGNLPEGWVNPYE